MDKLSKARSLIAKAQELLHEECSESIYAAQMCDLYEMPEDAEANIKLADEIEKELWVLSGVLERLSNL